MHTTLLGLLFPVFNLTWASQILTISILSMQNFISKMEAGGQSLRTLLLNENTVSTWFWSPGFAVVSRISFWVLGFKRKRYHFFVKKEPVSSEKIGVILEGATKSRFFLSRFPWVTLRESNTNPRVKISGCWELAFHFDSVSSSVSLGNADQIILGDASQGCCKEITLKILVFLLSGDFWFLFS